LRLNDNQHIIRRLLSIRDPRIQQNNRQRSPISYTFLLMFVRKCSLQTNQGDVGPAINSSRESLQLVICSLKPRPHQQQCPSNIAECYKLNDSFDNVEYCFDIVAGVDGALHSG